ncbi:MAG: NAD-binding protein [Candidatus Parvarchaeota archaeon]|nr:NAD-binding protein [Candidatus Parvarchaeota archaeon]
MDDIHENLQKVLIAAIILLLMIIILTVLISRDQNISINSAFLSIFVALETFNFRSDFGVLLLFLSLFMGVFAVYLIEFMVAAIRKEFGGVVYMAQTVKLKHHNIVCGGGRIGERVATLLKEQHKPVIIIESDEIRAAELKKYKFKVLKENALDEKSLKMANIKNAENVFACLGQDVDNFLVVLNTRELNKGVKVVSRCNAIKNVGKFKQLGANEVVLPEIVGADRMLYLAEKKK